MSDMNIALNKLIKGKTGPSSIEFKFDSVKPPRNLSERIALILPYPKVASGTSDTASPTTFNWGAAGFSCLDLPKSAEVFNVLPAR